MDSCDDTEVCEFVSLYLLSKISVHIDSDNFGLYSDNELAVINNTNSPKLDKMRKNIIATFKSEGSSITADTNLVETDFLNATFRLSTGKYYPYNKPNNAPLYIHVKSNHSNSIVKQLPEKINKIISELSCDVSAFNNAKATYELALKHSDYKSEMNFDRQPSTRRNRNRKIIWINPPFSQNVKTNIGKLFFKLVRKNFAKNHKFWKISDLNTLKLNYSSMTNL